MTWWSFGFLLNENTSLYILILLGSILLYYLIYKKMFLSILDPIIFTIFFSLFGFSVVVFLYITDNIQTKYLLSYLLTQAAFVGGFFTFKNLRKDKILSPSKLIKFEGQEHFVKIVFLVCSILYILIQLLSYKLVGIPLVLGTHVDIYNAGGGLGILGRVIDLLKPISIFLLFYYLFNKTSSIFIYIYKYFFLVFLLVFFILSGSRSEFMTLGFIFFSFIILNGNNLKKYFNSIRKFEIVILLIGLCFVFITILFQLKNKQDDTSSLAVFLFRLVASGDAYYFSYPNGNIETLNSSKPFLALFGDIFSTLRIIPRQSQPLPLGLQLYNTFYDSDVVVGPNARQNVFGYVYFGFYGSIIFSYLVGLSLSFVRNKVFFLLRKNVLGQILFVILYMNMSVIETDPPMVISNLENVLLILPFIFIISACFFIVTTNFEKKLVAT